MNVRFKDRKRFMIPEMLNKFTQQRDVSDVENNRNLLQMVKTNVKTSKSSR